MTAATGFYEQKTLRPGGLALVIALHAAAFAGLVLVKTDVMRTIGSDTIVTFLPAPPPPPEVTPPPEHRTQPTHESVIDAPPTIVHTQTQSQVTTQPQIEPQPPLGPPARETLIAATIPDVHVPVRVEAQFDPRYASQLQPPYPPHEEAAQRNGNVRIRITVGADGRVRAIECLNATSDAFCRATERHGVAHWRFRPATVDGRAVESTKTMNVVFRIEA